MPTHARRAGPLLVELVGAPGAGKTTLVGTVVEAAATAGLRPLTVVEALRVCAARTTLGRAALRLFPPARHRAALWGVSYLLSTVAAVALCAQRPRLMAHVVSTQRSRPAAAQTRERRVVFWFLRYMGTHRFLERRGEPGEVIVVDEGFLHRAVQLHASEVEVCDAGTIDRYVSRIPRPGLAVHVRAPADVCEQRVVRRGAWRRFDGTDSARLSSFVASAHRATTLAVEAARARGWRVVDVDNGGPTQERVRADLAFSLKHAFADLAATTVPEAAATTRRSRPYRAPRLVAPKPGRVRGTVLARRSPPRLDRGLVDRVLHDYDLTAVGEPRNLPQGWRNHNVVVSTSAGWVVLKRYPQRWTAGTVVHEHSILRQLAAVGFAAPRPCATPGGDTVVTLDGRRYALFAFEDGRNLSGCVVPPASMTRLLRRSGQLLGELHRALEGFVPQGDHHIGDAAHRDPSWYLARLAALMLLPDGGDSRWRWLADRAPAVAERIDELARALEHAPLRAGVIHGDFGLHNIIFRRDGTAVVHDFELARGDWQLVDLVITLGRLGPRAAQPFLDGYRHARPIEPGEWQLLPQVWELSRLCAAVRSWSNYDRYGGAHRLVTAADRVAEAQRIEREGVPPWR